MKSNVKFWINVYSVKVQKLSRFTQYNRVLRVYVLILSYPISWVEVSRERERAGRSITISIRNNFNYSPGDSSSILGYLFIHLLATRNVGGLCVILFTASNILTCFLSDSSSQFLLDLWLVDHGPLSCQSNLIGSWFDKRGHGRLAPILWGRSAQSWCNSSSLSLYIQLLK